MVSASCWCASNIGCCFSGWFRGDTLIGTAAVKLQPLETQCELHDSFDVSILQLIVKKIKKTYFVATGRKEEDWR